MLESQESLVQPLLGKVSEGDAASGPKTLSHGTKTFAPGKEDPFLQALSTLGDTSVPISFGAKVMCACSCEGAVVIGLEDGTLRIVASDIETPTILGKHEKSVHALSSSKGFVASGSIDGTVKVWHFSDRKEVTTFHGHKSPVTCLALTPNGKYVISASEEFAVKMWSLQHRQELPLVTSPVTCTSLTPRGHVKSGSWVKALKVVTNDENKSEFTLLQRHDGPVNCLEVTIDSKYVVSGSDDCKVKVWNIIEAREVATFQGHNGPVTCVGVTRDGKHVFSGSQDNTVKMWSVMETREVATLQQHGGEVTCLAVLPGDKHVISGSYDRTVKIWDIDQKKEVALNHTGPVSCLLILPDGKHFATGTYDQTVMVWKVGEAQVVATFQTDKGPVTQLSIIANNKLVVLGSDEQPMTILNLYEVKETTVFRGHTGQITCLTMLDDRYRMASGSLDNTVKIWDVEHAELLQTFKKGTSQETVFSKTPRGKHHPSRSYTARCLTADEIQELAQHVTCCTIMPDGERLLLGLIDGAVKLWLLDGWREIATLFQHSEEVTCIMVCPQTSQVVTGSTDGTIKILNVDHYSRDVETFSGHPQKVTCVLMLSKKKYLISGSKDKTVKIWRLTNTKGGYTKVNKTWSENQKKEVATLKGHIEKVTCVAYMEKRDYVVSGSKDKTIKVWSLKDLKEIATLQGHTDVVTCVSVHSDGNFVFSGGRDTTVRIWSLMEAREVAIIQEHSDWVTCLVVSKDEHYVISGSKDFTLCRTDLRLKIPGWRSKYFKEVTDVDFKSYYFCGKYIENLSHGVRISLAVAALPVLPFYINSLHICAHFNQSVQLEYYLKNEVPVVRSKFGSPLTIALKRNTIKCINVMLKHLTETCQTTSGFFAVQEITDDFPNLLKCNSPYIVPFFTQLLNKQTQPGLPEFIVPLNPLPCTLFKTERHILLRDFAQVKCSITMEQNQSKDVPSIDPTHTPNSVELEKDNIPTDQDGEVVKFLVSLFRWNFAIGSKQSLEFLRALEDCEDKHILTTPLISSLVQSKWDALLLIAWFHTFLYICLLLCLIGMAFNYYRFDVLSIAFIWLNLLFLLYELVQSSANGKDYWKDVWNYVDLLRGGLSITWGYLMYSGVGHLHYLNFAVVCMCFFRGFTFFRTFKMTRMFVRMTIEVVKDMYAFLVILGYSTCSFGMMYAVLAPETITSASGAWITAYELLMGTYNNDGFGLVRWLCFTAASLVNVIIMLNLLISILGDAYEKAQMSASENDTLEMLSLVIEYESMFFWRRKAKDSSVLIVCMSAGEDDTEEKWAGRIGEIRRIVDKSGQNLEARMNENVDAKMKDMRSMMETTLRENRLATEDALKKDKTDMEAKWEANKIAIEGLNAKLDQVLAALRATHNRP